MHCRSSRWQFPWQRSISQRRASLQRRETSLQRRDVTAAIAVLLFMPIGACLTQPPSAGDTVGSGGSSAPGNMGSTPLAGTSSGNGAGPGTGAGASAASGGDAAPPAICSASYQAGTLQASTGEAVDGGWNLYTTGTLSGSHTFTGGATDLTVMAYGSVASGVWPHMVVHVGGSVIGEVDVSAASWTTYPFHFSASAGMQPFQLEFTNDATVGAEDRNLYIASLGISESCAGSASGVANAGSSVSGGPSDGSNPFAGQTLYVDGSLAASGAEASLRGSGDTTDADLLKKISSSPQADWIGNWSGDPGGAVRDALNAAGSQMRVLVAYNIYNRDCGSQSAGGAADATAYKGWIDGFASGIGDKSVAIVLEPDTLAQDCDHTRWDALSYAVTSLKKQAHAHVYIDAGHSGWVDANTMATRLQIAGIANADGFALNVSAFQPTAESIGYGSSISGQVANKPFVIDTSRNGKGATGDWCNPPGRGLGEKPTTNTGNPLVHALLWIKHPGESDGVCNGGPSAGQWFQAYALDLAKNAVF